MVREIQLTRGKVAMVDDADYAELSKFKWHATPADQKRENWYARRTVTAPDGVARNVYMHRVILGVGPGEEADHLDRDGLNNQRYNLRRCTRRLNCANVTYALPASGYRGVDLMKDRIRNRWSARVTVSGKDRRIGYFDCPVKAARARDAYVLKLYGAFAILNFPAKAGAA